MQSPRARGGWKTVTMMQRYRKQNPERAHASSVKFEKHMVRLADNLAINADGVAEFPQ